MKRLQWLLSLVTILVAGLISFVLSAATEQRLNSLRQVDSPTLLRAQSLSFSLNAVHEGFSYAAAADKAAVAQAMDKAKQFRTELQALSEVPAYAAGVQTLGGQFDVYIGAINQVMLDVMALADGKDVDPVPASQRMQVAYGVMVKGLDALKTQSLTRRAQVLRG